MVKKTIIVGIICILTLVSLQNVISQSIPSQQSVGDDLAYEFTIKCVGGYVFAGFNIEYVHDVPDRTLQVQLNYTIEKQRDGTIIHSNPFDYITNTPSKTVVATVCGGGLMIKEWAKNKIFFGIFRINVDLHVLDDDSHQYKTFYCVYVIPHIQIIRLG